MGSQVLPLSLRESYLRDSTNATLWVLEEGQEYLDLDLRMLEMTEVLGMGIVS
jgi:hypothetical protein